MVKMKRWKKTKEMKRMMKTKKKTSNSFVHSKYKENSPFAFFFLGKDKGIQRKTQK